MNKPEIKEFDIGIYTNVQNLVIGAWIRNSGRGVNVQEVQWYTLLGYQKSYRD